MLELIRDHRPRDFPVIESQDRPRAKPHTASPLTRKLSAFVNLSNNDLAVLSDLSRQRRVFPAGRDMIHQGQKDQAAYVLAEGWVCSYKLMPNGTRQVVGFQIPGDFLGLRSVLFRTSDLSVEPITRVEASEVKMADFLESFARKPKLATAVLWAASRDEAMVVEHLVGLGRRNAIERTAHFLLELSARLRLVGLGDKAGYDCPLSQYMLADALGLSAVHVNRTLRELREAGLLTFQKGRVEFDDFEGLVGLADFDRAYLDHDGPLLR
jgi:CRP-like cAMP-binding protein